MVSIASQPVLSQSSAESAKILDLVINLRVQTEPSVLEETVQHSFDAWIERIGLTVLTRAGYAFKPQQPEPTHRIVGAG